VLDDMTAQSFTVPASLERTRLRIYAIQLLLDGIMLLAGFALSTWLYLGSPTEDTVWGSAQLALPLFWTVALLNRTYSVQALIAPEFGVQRAALALLLASLLVLLALFLARSSLNLSRFGFGLGCLAALFMMVWARYNMEPLVRRWVGARAINRWSSGRSADCTMRWCRACRNCRAMPPSLISVAGPGPGCTGWAAWALPTCTGSISTLPPSRLTGQRRPSPISIMTTWVWGSASST
jgi:hypothetical protein